MKIHIIDLNFHKPMLIAAFLIETEDGPVLIETGPDSTFPTLQSSLKNLGYSIQDIKKVLVTHVHLDHAGSAWRFAQSGAVIYVHPRGAAHLADPGNLIASAKKIFKGQMEMLWGEIKPIPKELIHNFSDGESLIIGKVEIKAVETLGHAVHHNIYLVDNNVFAGDIAGVRINNGPVLPPTPPPDINVEIWRQSIRKVRSFKPQAIYITHFGEFTDVDRHLEELELSLINFTEFVLNKLRDEEKIINIISDFDNLIDEKFEETQVNPEVISTYKGIYSSPSNVRGLLRYLSEFKLAQK